MLHTLFRIGSLVPDKTFHKKNTEKEQRVEWWLPGVREGGDGRIGDMLFTGANVQRQDE